MNIVNRALELKDRLTTVKSSVWLAKFTQQQDQSFLNIKNILPEPVGMWFGWSLHEAICTWETYFD